MTQWTNRGDNLALTLMFITFYALLYKKKTYIDFGITFKQDVLRFGLLYFCLSWHLALKSGFILKSLHEYILFLLNLYFLDLKDYQPVDYYWKNCVSRQFGFNTINSILNLRFELITTLRKSYEQIWKNSMKSHK